MSKNVPTVLEIVALVNLKVLKQGRAKTYTKRLLCKITGGNKDSGFVLQSKCGIIRKKCHPRELELVTGVLNFTTFAGAKYKFITLGAAAQLSFPAEQCEVHPGEKALRV